MNRLPTKFKNSLITIGLILLSIISLAKSSSPGSHAAPITIANNMAIPTIMNAADCPDVGPTMTDLFKWMRYAIMWGNPEKFPVNGGAGMNVHICDYLDFTNVSAYLSHCKGHYRGVDVPYSGVKRYMNQNKENGVCFADRIFDMENFSGGASSSGAAKFGSCITNPTDDSLENCVRVDEHGKCSECHRGHVLRRTGPHNHCDPSLDCPFGCQTCEEGNGGHLTCKICDEYWIIGMGDTQCIEMDSYVDDDGNKIYDNSAERIEFCKFHELKGTETVCHVCYYGYVIVDGICQEATGMGLKGCRLLDENTKNECWECRSDHYQHSAENNDCRRGDPLELYAETAQDYRVQERASFWDMTDSNLSRNFRAYVKTLGVERQSQVPYDCGGPCDRVYGNEVKGTKKQTKVYWSMEKLPMGKEDCETSNEMMQAGYVPSGLLDTLVCKGKIDPRNGRTHWAVSQNHFHVFEQFIVTRNDRDAEFLDYFFLGEACDKGAPKRPDVGDEDCFWAMKIGSWFADGKVVNTVKAKDTQTESVRSCIQTVWGKPGYQMKCFMRGLDPDFDKIQKGPSPHGYEWLEDVTDSEAPIDELWATAHGSDYNTCKNFVDHKCQCFPMWKSPNKTGPKEKCKKADPAFHGCLEAVKGSTTKCALCKWGWMLEDDGKCTAPDGTVVDKKGRANMCGDSCNYCSRQTCLICAKKYWPLRDGTGCTTHQGTQAYGDVSGRGTDSDERTTDVTMIIPNCDYHDMRNWNAELPISKCYECYPTKVLASNQRKCIEIDMEDVQSGCRILNKGGFSCGECLPGYTQTKVTNTACYRPTHLIVTGDMEKQARRKISVKAPIV